jgi:hypothetical protein
MIADEVLGVTRDAGCQADEIFFPRRGEYCTWRAHAAKIHYTATTIASLSRLLTAHHDTKLRCFASSRWVSPVSENTGFRHRDTQARSEESYSYPRALGRFEELTGCLYSVTLKYSNPMSVHRRMRGLLEIQYSTRESPSVMSDQ